MQGVVSEVRTVAPADHLCWVYDDADSFTAAAGRFLAGGLARGEQLLVVGPDDAIERLRHRPGALGALDDLVAAGRLTLLPLSDAYDGDGDFSPERQLAFYDGATRRAL